MLKKILHFTRRYGWSAKLTSFTRMHPQLHWGDDVTFSGFVTSRRLRLGAVYIQIQVASAADHAKVIFDSDNDLDISKKRGLRLSDISPGASVGFSLLWVVNSCFHTAYDARVILWSPEQLFKGREAQRYFISPWEPCFVVSPKENIDGPNYSARYEKSSVEA